ncbi:MAG: hypothetical protein MUD10_01800 [Candidatus Pacebacteria bacterium]|nr:hypothetical protein [Candidatus Paceibacterota bacterium]
MIDWSEVTLQALQDAWGGIVEFTPRAVIGLAIFVIGWIIAAAAGKVLARLLKKINFDSFFARSGWKNALEGADIKVNPSEFVGAITKWIIVILFLQIFAVILGLGQFADYLTKVLEWLPNVVVAAAIFVVSIILADILEKVIKASARRLEIRYTNLLGAIVRGSIYTFAVLAILMQLQVAQTIIATMVTGFVGMLALAFGLAFGLGGKDAAAEMISNLKDRLKDK